MRKQRTKALLAMEKPLGSPALQGTRVPIQKEPLVPKLSQIGYHAHFTKQIRTLLRSYNSIRP